MSKWCARLACGIFCLLTVLVRVIALKELDTALVFTRHSWVYRYRLSEESASDLIVQNSSRLNQTALPNLGDLYQTAATLRGSDLDRVIAFIGTFPGNVAAVGFNSWWLPSPVNTVEFFFQSFNNASRDTYLVNFDDGTDKEHAVHEGSSVRVSYASAGLKSIRVRSANEKESQGSVSLFKVSATQLAFPTTWFVSTPSPSGGTVSGAAYVFRAPSSGRRGQLRKPLIIVEGFDPFNEVGSGTIIDILVAADALEPLQEAGWDIIILNFDDGAGAIQLNAQLLRQVLERTNSEKAAQAEIAVLGLVSR
jgi:hypothetical protein